MNMGELKTNSKVRQLRILKRFSKNADGATAVEFALVGMPFFLLLFAIIEVSIFFFAGQALESSVDNVARLVRTGQLDNNSTEAEFKTAICDATSALFDCSGIHVDLTIVAEFDDLSDPPTPTDLATDLAAFQFTPPAPSKVAMITVMYEWPVVTNYVAAGLSDLDSGNALLSTVAVFKTEPWPES